MAEKLRQEYIDSIMESQYNDDDRNRAFLESLSTEELQNLSEELTSEFDPENY